MKHVEGVPKDHAEAVKWFRKAADQGYAKAQYNLGGCYYKGQGVPKDDVMAYMWCNLSAAGGDENAAKIRGALEKEMTPEQIIKAKILSREWKPKKEEK